MEMFLDAGCQNKTKRSQLLLLCRLVLLSLAGHRILPEKTGLDGFVISRLFID